MLGWVNVNDLHPFADKTWVFWSMSVRLVKEPPGFFNPPKTAEFTFGKKHIELVGG